MKLHKQLEIYPFKWEFNFVRIPHKEHLNIIRNFLVAPLISTANVNYYSINHDRVWKINIKCC